MTEPSRKNRTGILVFCLLIVFTALIVSARQTDARKLSNRPPLSGVVTSLEENRMEGVLVTAKRKGSTISITVVSDHNGRYTFPPGRLQAGTYHLNVRAVGYELDEPAPIQVFAEKATERNLTLRKTHKVASQLTSAEWLASVPGTPQQKDSLYRCVACHTLTPVVESKYSAEAWLATLSRMENWAPPSVIPSPVPAPNKVAGGSADKEFASYLSTINLHSRSTWDYELKSFPRPTGDATKVIITEFDLPRRDALPHDAVVDPEGIIWYNDFQQPVFGRLDPRTGQTQEWRLPVLWPGFPEGLLEIRLDRKGDVWLPRFFQGCTLTRFNPKTHTFQSWTVSPKYNDDRSRCSHVALETSSDIVWFSDSGNRRMFKLDPSSGQIDEYDSFPNYSAADAPSIETAGRKSKGHRTYDIAVDSKGNPYFADIAGGTIGEMDGHTGKVTLYPTPTPESGPRRMYMDSTDRLWFGENYASKLGMFDTKTKQFREWTPPIPWNGAYPAAFDKEGHAWTVGMSTDYVYRLDPESGNFTEYLLPTLGANLRKIDVDNSTTPVTVWVAEVHAGKIAKLEFLP